MPSTPCVGVCRLDERGLCLGCGRTLQQVVAWPTMTEPERQRVMKALAHNRALAGTAAAPQRGARPVVHAAKRAPRIVSLLPAATEMAFALGLGDAVVGVSHECDFPSAARCRAVVVRPALSLKTMSPKQIDAAVSQRLAQGQSLYEIDASLLQALRPELILTQDLCQVCAPSGAALGQALCSIHPQPAVLALSPHRLADILENVQALGRASGQETAAQQLTTHYGERLARVQAAAPPPSGRPRVFFMEWTDPLYCSGHWVPEMIAMAGGTDALARAGQNSVRIAWEDVLRWAPEVLIIAPCGYDTRGALALVPSLMKQPGWSSLPAVRAGRVYCVDANAYFARPGPRAIDGVELLAHLLHPQRHAWDGPTDAYRAV